MRYSDEQQYDDGPKLVAKTLLYHAERRRIIDLFKEAIDNLVAGAERLGYNTRKRRGGAEQRFVLHKATALGLDFFNDLSSEFGFGLVVQQAALALGVQPPERFNGLSYQSTKPNIANVLIRTSAPACFQQHDYCQHNKSLMLDFNLASNHF